MKKTIELEEWEINFILEELEDTANDEFHEDVAENAQEIIQKIKEQANVKLTKLEMYEKKVRELKITIGIEDTLACIYDLYQDYRISEEQEQYLYSVADPLNSFNSPAVYWWNMSFKNPLLAI